MVKQVVQILFMICFFIATAGPAEACPACWAGYGPGAERFNKPLADLRILYEAQGNDALPEIKKILKKSNTYS